MAWPAAGASMRIRSGASSSPAAIRRSICFTLPSTRMSRMPGMAVATMSITPEVTRRLESALQAGVVEVLDQGVVGGEGAGHDRRHAGGLVACGHLDLVVVEGLAPEHRWPGPTCPRPRRSGGADPAGRRPGRGWR